MQLEEVKKIVEESGLKHTFIASNLGMSDDRFYRLLSGRQKWTVDDIKAFSHFFRLTQRQKSTLFLP